MQTLHIFFLIFLSTVFTVAGQLLFRRGMLDVGEVSFSLQCLWKNLGGTASNIYVIMMKNTEKPKVNRFEIFISKWLILDKKLMVLFFVALAVRLGLFAAIAPWDDRVWQERIAFSDAGGYHQIGVNLVEHRVYSVYSLSSFDTPIAPRQRIVRTPVYPFFVAGIYAVSGYRVYMVLVLQAVMGALSCLIVYRIGSLLFNKKVGFLAGCLLAVDFASLLYANMLMTETLFTFLFLISIYFVVKFFEKSSIKYLAWTGFFMGLATLCRPISLYFPVFLVPFLIFSGFFKRARLMRRIANGAFFTLIFLLTLSPWLIRNTIVSGFPYVSSMARMAPLNNAAYLEQARSSRSLTEIRAELGKELENLVKGKNLSEAEEVKVAQKLGLEKIMKHPVLYARVHLAGVFSILLEPGSSEFWRVLGREPRGFHILSTFLTRGPWGVVASVVRDKSLSQICYIAGAMVFLLAIYIALIVGVIGLTLKRKYSLVILFLAIMGYFVLTVGPLGNMRYRIPIMPYIILLAAYGLTRFSQAGHWVRRLRSR